MPSGTLWATCNIGANSPEEAGLYFAWGGTQGYTAEQVGNEEGKRAFTWNNYEFGPVTALTRYNITDNLIVLKPEDDAATANWGSGWRMPTKEEFEELTANTEYEWTEIDGVQGGKFTSKVSGYTDKFLFFPAVGGAGNGGVGDVGGCGNFWSASLTDKNVRHAWKLDFGDGDCGLGNGSRCYGFSVRPVRL